MNEMETKSETEKTLVATKEEKGGRGKMWEVAICRCKLVYIGWISNKVLLYSQGNSIQHSLINHNEKYEKEYVYIYTHIHIYTYIYIYNYLTLMYSRN